MGSFSYDVSRHDLEAIIASMPTDICRAMHRAAREGDLATAQHLLREAAAQYLTSTPVAPAVAPAPPHPSTRPTRRAGIRYRS
jgi:hypothetical protein